MKKLRGERWSLNDRKQERKMDGREKERTVETERRGRSYIFKHNIYIYICIYICLLKGFGPYKRTLMKEG